MMARPDTPVMSVATGGQLDQRRRHCNNGMLSSVEYELASAESRHA